ncbi:MAG: FHA domain-containing protein [Candidatus Caenarcaniphilales bacterium]|nr:FHA domain-containing protein [Candidatus Caenarcaniphilales bacterium]
MSRARLLLINDTGEISQEFEIGQPNIIIGRSPQSNVVIDNSDVSRAHAQIVSTPNGFFVSDMGSTNGTFLNGAVIKAKQMFQLKSNDQVNLGNVSLMFQIVPDTFPNLEPTPEMASSDFNSNFNQNQNQVPTDDYSYNSSQTYSNQPIQPEEYSYPGTSFSSTNYSSTPVETFHEQQEYIGEFPSQNFQEKESFGQNQSSFNQNSNNLNSHPYEQGAYTATNSYAEAAPSRPSEQAFTQYNSSQETLNQPTYIPPFPAPNQNAAFSSSQAAVDPTSFFPQTAVPTAVPQAALSDEELKLAMEIFGEENNKSKAVKKDPVKWAGWDKTGLFKQNPIAPKTTKSAASEISEDELFNQVFGGSNSTFIPGGAFDDPLANKQVDFPSTNIPNTSNSLSPVPSNFPVPIAKEQKALLPPNNQDFLFPNLEQETNSFPVPTPNQSSRGQQYVVDTESYYYPTASTNNEALFQKENYSYDGNQNSEEDPFNALKYSEEDSIFSKFKNSPQQTYSPEELKEKLRRETQLHPETKPNLQTIIKNYALPIGLIVGAVVFAVFMYFRNSGLFG